MKTLTLVLIASFLGMWVILLLMVLTIGWFIDMNSLGLWNYVISYCISVILMYFGVKYENKLVK